MSIGQIITRGITAAHGVWIGVFYLFVLHAPVQVVRALGQSIQERAVTPGQAPDARIVLLSMAVTLTSFALAVLLFFLYPLVLGGILGRVRDRLESAPSPTGNFWACGRAHYVRLLGSLGLFTLAMVVAMFPVGCLVGLAFYEVEALGSAVEEAPASLWLLSKPLFFAAIGISSFLASVAAMIYWVANSIVVAEQEAVLASWRKALLFCRQNLAAVLLMWFLAMAVGLVVSPLGMLDQLGIVKELWALVVLALVYAALIGYSGVLLPGLIMSLYLARRPQSSGRLESGLSAVA
jgi:hypothetical protein